MKLHILFYVSLIVSFSSLAGTLRFTDDISVLGFDGQKISNKERKVNLTNGKQHQLVFRVSQKVKEGSNEKIVTSKPIIVTFAGINDDLTLQVPVFKNISDVDRYNKAPTLELYTNTGDKVSYQQDILKQEGGFFPDANIISDIANYNSTNRVASVAGLKANSMITGSSTDMPTINNKVTLQGENVAEQMLQYWFQQADPATKQRFLKWAHTHSN